MSARLEPTRQLAVKVWWAFMWRSALGTLAAGFVVGMGLGLAAQALSLPAAALDALSAVAGLALGVGISIEVMFRVLRQKFTGFEIALVERQD